MRASEWIADPNVAAFYVFIGAWRVHALRPDEFSLVIDQPPPRPATWVRRRGRQGAEVAISADQCLRIDRTIFTGAIFRVRMEVEIDRLRMAARERIEGRAA